MDITIHIAVLFFIRKVAGATVINDKWLVISFSFLAEEEGGDGEEEDAGGGVEP